MSATHSSGAEFAPGVLELLKAAHGDEGAAAADAKPAAPVFVDAATRSKAFPLDHPVTFDGREVREIWLHRLTTKEVGAFVDLMNALDEKARGDLYWPIYRLDAEGTPAPSVLLDGLDPDDMDVLTKAASDFLPRRPAEWRFYRALVRRGIGWSMAEMMDMFWDQLLLEVIEARDLEGMSD